jgi:tellurite resistance protein TerC
VYLPWALFIAFVGVILVLDMGMLHRRVREISLLEALVWSGFWIVLALGFAVAIYFGYENHWWQLGEPTQHGYQAMLQYLTVYVTSKSLSLDNLFAIALIFAHFDIPRPYQARAFSWGIVGALALRTLVITIAALAYHQFSWMHYAFAGVVLFTAFRMLVKKPDAERPDSHRLLHALQQRVPTRTDVPDERFLTRIDGRRAITTVLLSMLAVQFANGVFALESVPALFAITTDPFLVFTANVFAILGLRALYFVIAHGLQELRYLRISLVILLAAIGIKLLFAPSAPIPVELTLVIVLGIIAAGIVASFRSRKPTQGTYLPEFAQELGHLYDITYAGLRRIVVLAIGMSVIIVGILMIFTPGPAIVVIPAGLAILATEFVWARIVLHKFKEKFVHYSKETMQLFERGKNRKKHRSGDEQ